MYYDSVTKAFLITEISVLLVTGGVREAGAGHKTSEGGGEMPINLRKPQSHTVRSTHTRDPIPGGE